MRIAGWNLLTNSTATDRALRTLRESVAGPIGGWNGQLVLCEKYLQLFSPGYTHKALYGGRGTAKTTTIALYIILRMDAAYTVVAGLRKRQVSIRHSSKRVLERAIRWLGLTHRFEVLHTEIRNRVTGSIAFFRGLEHDSDETTRGLDGVDIFWLDEARNVSMQALMNLVRVLRERGAELISSWNPLDPQDAIEQLYRGDVPPQHLLLLETTQDDNPAFFTSPMADEYWRLKAADEQMWQHVYGGKHDSAGGERVYDKIEIGEVPWQYLAGGEPCYGLDLGYVDDPTAAVRVWVLQQHKLIYFEKEAVGYGEDANGIADLLDHVLHEKDAVVTSDNSEQRTTDALNAKGYNLVTAKKGAGSVIEGIRFIRGYRIVVNPDCETVIEETKHYKWKLDRQSGKRTQVPRKGHDHCLDAGRYAIMGREASIEAGKVEMMQLSGF
ncbi:phage terminase large subunit [Mesorhizobium sp. LHD-90]|uniref:PBSX family phage terminase large subunit n=1 Tax=Mesorhizobium sp. LHD-90 TaxID=3071414 RepID=UPI0027DF5FDE|nr:phage terminase large subunit [Mesorhizobium sp. LHD-90]MDQ6433765.1 phage terminase large subunit [Mesorhizobium sp. LHD-90]